MSHSLPMTSMQPKQWRAGRFGTGGGVPSAAQPLRALVFDLDALTDIECDGHRVAYNAAFAAHDLDFQWTVTRYRQLLALTDERQRVAAELRKRCVATESDVLTALLADDIYTTKTMMFDELIEDHDLAPRPGLVDLTTRAFAAGVRVAVVTRGNRSWAEPLVRRLMGAGVVDSLVTGEDVKKHMPDPQAHRLALTELGLSAEDALAVSGSAAGLRAANAAGLATIVITGQGSPNLPAAAAVRPNFGGSHPLSLADCQRIQGNWWRTHRPSAA